MRLSNALCVKHCRLQIIQQHSFRCQPLISPLIASLHMSPVVRVPGNPGDEPDPFQKATDTAFVPPW